MTKNLFCPKCGKQLKENQKFCSNCGFSLVEVEKNKEAMKPKNIRLYVIVAIIVLFVFVGVCFFVFKKAPNTDEIIEQENVSYNASLNEEKTDKQETLILSSSKVLNQINNYQMKYFSIIKRNDMFLYAGDYDNYEKDRSDLEALYNEVKRNINQNSDYYKKYLAIEEEFKECNGETMLEMNEFASNYYNAIDKLLNEVYQAVKMNLQEDDFIALRTTQRQWLKDITAYDNVFKQQDFGSMGTMIKFDYQTDMRKFRTLLLMMYL